jgi:ubiquinone/menaquinone biosynthesis C-methylase UbiE
VYTSRANAALEAVFARRTAIDEAAFFLPHLHPGMRLLDCGSGPGSITCDLAAVVAPGAVVGLDIQPSQVEQARTLARDRGITNAQFELGSIYAVPLADTTFDAAFAHMVLMHLRDPLPALKELRRVLKPGGVVGIRDTNYGLWQFSPTTPLLEAFRALERRIRQHNGWSPFYAGHQRQFLLEASFARSEASAEFLQNGAGTLAKTRRVAAFQTALLRGPEFRATALGQGRVDEAVLETMATELQAWGQRPDAFGGCRHNLSIV